MYTTRCVFMCCSVQQHHLQYIVERCPRFTRGQTGATPFMRLAQSGRFTLLLPSECISQHGSQTFYLVQNAKAFSKRAFSYAYVGYLNNPMLYGVGPLVLLLSSWLRTPLVLTYLLYTRNNTECLSSANGITNNPRPFGLKWLP